MKAQIREKGLIDTILSQEKKAKRADKRERERERERNSCLKQE
tara:strand:+ start:149 stop:277 length:129 start_codon:yes stop_codon:yes gene_type:complete